MAFMRKHTPAPIQQQPALSNEPGLRDLAAELAGAPTLDPTELLAFANHLCALFRRWMQRHAVPCGAAKQVAVSCPVWKQFFDFVDKEKLGRIVYLQFEGAVKRLLDDENAALSAEQTQATTFPQHSLLAFWRGARDLLGRGREGGARGGRDDLTHHGLVAFVSQLQIGSWPVLEGSELKKVVDLLNAVANFYYRCDTNWRLVFKGLADSLTAALDGDLEFEELLGVLRRPFPGLAISPKRLSDDQFKGLWRVLDVDWRGLVSTCGCTAGRKIRRRLLRPSRVMQRTFRRIVDIASPSPICNGKISSRLP
eukprot:TRINITY_DN54085_c0_g1_i1.p1 TRINITY_DN54085_c0_g1~~TRINITY_DN54085_c0_g1_i1.p1  ORF type:complete len:356 (+),score=86.60 TRINITY_DN54085_c0_g1_i1:140-1069(+)